MNTIELFGYMFDKMQFIAVMILATACLAFIFIFVRTLYRLNKLRKYLIEIRRMNKAIDKKNDDSVNNRKIIIAGRMDLI